MSTSRLFLQALAVSSGSISYLIDCTSYEIIDVVQREFCFFCLRHPEHETWKDAWKAFAKTDNDKGYVFSNYNQPLPEWAREPNQIQKCEG